MGTQLAEIKEIIKVCEQLVDKISKAGKVSSPDPTYDNYKQLIDSFCRKYDIKNNSSELVKITYRALCEYYWSRTYTVNEKEAKDILELVISLKEQLFPNLYEKIFISHREIDSESVDAFKDLLHVIGIPRAKENEDKVIFCTSHPAAYIENGCKISKEIQNQFYSRKRVLFILWYTDNYFESQACLNEMGAIWVMNKNYQEILMPGFDRKKIGGLMDKEEISFYANDNFRLNTFKEQIEKMFELQPITLNEWEKAKEKYIEKIEAFAKRSR